MEKLSRKEVKKQLKSLIKLFNKPLSLKSKKLSKRLKKEKQDTIQELIDALRVGIKYLMFAVEANGRENKMLRKLLRDNGIEI